jgi:hypothetical protein
VPGESKERLMNQSGHAQRVPRPLPAHIRASYRAEFFVNQRDEFLERFNVSSAPSLEKTGKGSGIKRPLHEGGF